MTRIRRLLAATFLTVSPTVALSAQSAADQVAQGDKAFAALDPQTALKDYEAAITADPKNVDALLKASRSAITIGEFADSARNGLGEYTDSTRGIIFHKAQDYAERAVALDSFNTDARFLLAMSTGRLAMGEQLMGRLPYAQKVYKETKFCLKLNPKSAECAHVFGEWHAEIMRLDKITPGMSGMVRMMGGKDLEESSWTKVLQYLKMAVGIEPNRIIHHYDLARAYVDVEDNDKAKAEFETVLKLPIGEYNDKFYKAAAQKALDGLGK